MRNVCIIPARGGSKRIPRKNIKEFLGKPIIAYSIETAIESDLFDEIMVSTDDNEIAEIAKRYGASVPFMRSKENGDDYATTFDVLNEVINEYQKQRISFENCCCLYPCAPLLTSDKLKQAYQSLQNFDMVMPVKEFSFPIQRSLKLDNEGKLSFKFPEFELARSQDLEKTYHDVGQFYFFKILEVLSNRNLMVDNTGAIVIPELESQDIDTMNDWKMAKLKYKLIHGLS